MHTRVRIDAQTGLAYFAKALRDEGFRGDVMGLVNARTLTLIIPGTRLIDVKRSLEAMLADLEVRIGYQDMPRRESDLGPNDGGGEPMTPSERSIRARIGAYSLHAQGRTNTGPAREKFMERFLWEVDPGGMLSETERQRRAEAAKKAYFSRLALKSAQAPMRTPPRL